MDENVTKILSLHGHGHTWKLLASNSYESDNTGS